MSRLGQKIKMMGHPKYEHREWIAYLRDHVGMHIAENNAMPIEVKQDEAYRFEGDFFGYLRYLGYGPEGDWLHLRINHMKHPTEWKEGIRQIRLISDSLIQEWYAGWAEAMGKREE